MHGHGRKDKQRLRHGIGRSCSDGWSGAKHACHCKLLVACQLAGLALVAVVEEVDGSGCCSQGGVSQLITDKRGLRLEGFCTGNAHIARLGRGQPALARMHVQRHHSHALLQLGAHQHAAVAALSRCDEHGKCKRSPAPQLRRRGADQPAACQQRRRQRQTPPCHPHTPARQWSGWNGV